MKKLTPIWFLLLGTLMFVGCEKCGIKKKDTNQIEFLSYWFFGGGSYWIYELNNSGVYDTVTIEKATVTEDMELFIGEDYHSKGRYYELDLLHSNYDFYGNYYSSAQEQRSGMLRINYDDWAMIQNFKHPSGLPAIFSNFITFDYPYQLNDSIFSSTYISDETTVNTPAGVFERTVVIKTYHNWYNDSLQDPFIQELYLTPGVGTTRIIMTGGNTWDLIEYYAPPYCEKLSD